MKIIHVHKKEMTNYVPKNAGVPWWCGQIKFTSFIWNLIFDLKCLDYMGQNTSSYISLGINCKTAIYNSIKLR